MSRQDADDVYPDQKIPNIINKIINTRGQTMLQISARNTVCSRESFTCYC